MFGIWFYVLQYIYIHVFLFRCSGFVHIYKHWDFTCFQKCVVDTSERIWSYYEYLIKVWWWNNYFTRMWYLMLVPINLLSWIFVVLAVSTSLPYMCQDDTESILGEAHKLAPRKIPILLWCLPKRMYVNISASRTYGDTYWMQGIQMQILFEGIRI